VQSFCSSCIATQRYLATGEFSLATRHGGTSILGSYLPDSGFGWTDPYPFLVAKHPELIDPPVANRMQQMPQTDGKPTSAYWAALKRRVALELTIAEIMKRPCFHAMRRLGALYYSLSVVMMDHMVVVFDFA